MNNKVLAVIKSAGFYDLWVASFEDIKFYRISLKEITDDRYEFIYRQKRK